MVEIGEAIQLIEKNQLRGSPMRLPLDLAAGLILAEDIRTSEPLPRYDSSAMDGIALRFPIAPGDEIELVGEASAGNPFEGEIVSGKAIRISTGAMIPKGADTVIPLEELTWLNRSVVIKNEAMAGQHIRLMGEELRENEWIASC